MTDNRTINCDEGRHVNTDEGCHGYIAPLVYGATRKCECECHDFGKRNYNAAERRALASYYS